MAAEKSKTTTASCSGGNTKSNPFSYANAVSNCKNDSHKANSSSVDDKGKNEDDMRNTCDDKMGEEDKSNKENEGCNENISTNAADKDKVSDFPSLDGNTPEPDDDFIDYSNSKRKKKLLKTKKKEVAFMPAPPASSSFSSTLAKNGPIRGGGHPYDRVRPKRKEKPLIPFSDEIDELNYCDNIKYVEAPVPKVNPWTVNKNAASVIKGELTRSTSRDTNQTSDDVCKYFSIII